ncbi:hypothetical protein [Vibrio jasicida]|uniref:hypothetical protein n=1 Tax=Vibrio jasicida TaxID=766224 RepID=UPI000697FE38|nr:hypothetical protein [Vibrio jasicida]
MPKSFLPPMYPCELDAKNQQYLHDVHCSIVEQLAMLGVERIDIAHKFFRVEKRQFEKWRLIYPDFDEAYDQGSIMADVAVTKSLFNRARGVTVTKQKIDKNNDIVDIEEELPPDTNACLAWLERKRRDKWSKDKTVVGNFDDPLEFILGDIDEQMTEASVIPAQYQTFEGEDDEQEDGG